MEDDDLSSQIFDIVVKNSRVQPILFGGVFFNLIILGILIFILLKVNAIHFFLTHP
jgi:hypothetical protein